MKDHQVFVVSLPRTGTTSMCKMLNMVGYKAKHVPSCFYEKWTAEGYDAFADTPCFAPTFIKERAITNPKNKFIYIDKNIDEWASSFESVKLDRSYNILLNIRNPKDLNVVRINEIKAYGEVFGFSGIYDQDLFKLKAVEHRQDVFSMLPTNQLLFYDYSMGWKPLCDFLGVSIPNVEIPIVEQEGKNWRKL
jgi:hypothetical protein